MSTIKDLTEAKRQRQSSALEVVNDQKLTTAEKRSMLEKLDTEIQTLDKDLHEEVYLDEQRKRFAPVADAEPTGSRTDITGVYLGGPGEVHELADTNHGSVGRAVTETQGFKSIRGQVGKGARWSTGAIDVKVYGNADLKTTLTEGSGSGGQLVQPDVQPGILPLLFQRVTVADLMPSGTTTSNTVRYLKETTATNAASSVAEGAAKPQSTLVFAQVDEPVRKVATTMKVSDEMLEDYGQLTSYIDNRLMLFVQIEEEAQLLTGNGVAPDLTGLLNRSGIQTQAVAASDAIGAVFKAVTKVRVGSFLDPTAIVMHPTDWQTIRLAKDTTNGQYYGGGPFTGAYGNGPLQFTGSFLQSTETLWGLPVVVTQNVSQGTALVGAFRTAAQVFRRSNLTLELTNSNEDDFLKNLVAIRAEERLALACYRPAAFCTVTGL